MSDAWDELRQFTQARIGLARSGHATSTEELLKFQRAHAEARDAVLSSWNIDQLSEELRVLGVRVIKAKSKAENRAQFLRRPDLGRQLLQLDSKDESELSLIVSDGLSAKAIDRHFLPFWKIFSVRLSERGFKAPPVVLAPFGRVALADEIGERLKSKLSVIFIGERPGLSSTDSMGIYLTYAPSKGRNDAQRNCISNVRPPQGLSYELAADKLIYLVTESLRLQLSGIGLKEESGRLAQAVGPSNEIS